MSNATTVTYTDPVAGNVTVSTLDTVMTNKQPTKAASGDFVDGAIITIGALADVAYAGSGNASLVSILKGIYAKLAGSIAVTGTFWQATQPVSLPTLTWTQTSVALTAATSATLIASNASRKALRWMVVGSNPMTVAPGAGPVTANAGFNYNGSSASGFQGGSDDFTGEISTQQFSAISTLGTTAIVWEGV